MLCRTFRAVSKLASGVIYIIPIWKWVGKRFAAIAFFDGGTLVIGAELLEAGVIFFIGPFMLAFAHVERQAQAFAKLDAARAQSPLGDSE